MVNRICTVTTLKAPLEQTLDFVNYHLNIGVDHMFLFFDDPQDPVIKKLREYKKVTCFKCDEEHWKKRISKKDIKNIQKRKMISSYNSKYLGQKQSDSDLSLDEKQQLNSNFALKLTKKNNFRFIIHLDSDELIYLQKKSLKKSLKKIPKNIDFIRLLPLEAVPEKHNHKNPFREITLFKNFGIIARFYYPYKKNLLKTFSFLRKREGTLRNIYFKGHAAGKSIVRINNKISELGMHEPIPKKNSELKEISYKNIKLLHFDCKNFENWKQKWIKIHTGETIAIGYNEKNMTFFEKFINAYKKGDNQKMKAIYAEQYFIPFWKKTLLRIVGLLVKIKIPQKLFKKNWDE
ncbi:glycosyltransferase family 2 protein [Candidatus Babeliales bacterium]|nr:glycosyltransferase family 2 protein [Candidatus Babeliales bacterium]